MQSKFKQEESSTGTSKQTQKAGANSEQYQANTIIVNNGITEERARAIFSEMNSVAMKEYTEDANRLATERVTKLEECLMKRIDTVEELLPAFQDPAFQIAMKHAQITAAACEGDDDYAILSELLVSHAKNRQNRQKKTSIMRAIEIIDGIDEQALCALTVCFVMTNVRPLAPSYKNGIHTMNETISKILYTPLPNGREWMDHLDIVGTVRVSSLTGVKRLLDFYSEAFNGYICAGIKAGSETHEKAAQLLQQHDINPATLVSNELLEGYVTIPAVCKSSIVDFQKDGKLLNKDGIEALNQVWDMYEKSPDLIEKAKRNFMNEWDSYPTLKTVHDWWDALPMAFTINQVGRALAYTNARRCDPTLPIME